jgi:hypothetical protein
VVALTPVLRFLTLGLDMTTSDAVEAMVMGSPRRGHDGPVAGGAHRQLELLKN